MKQKTDKILNDKRNSNEILEIITKLKVLKSKKY